MRFSALLFLAALAGVLVYAEGASSDPTPEAAAAAEPEGTTSAAKPASPQEPAQEPQSAAPEFLTNKDLLVSGHGLEEAKKALHKGVELGRRFYEGGAEWKRNLRNWSAKLNLFGV
ncbi:extracellular glycoprotein lacritin isoform X1 [Mustela putorius furo]|uniref:Extracellular glycoprotein lacritin isoform X1 n=1 Tax=Mustela putorius furo TaxID=9669 RepID=A0A8U0RTW6_MUSPF|nr:extracellular glycoprotein lacritin isoform X1 [Mustela putorius furo]